MLDLNDIPIPDTVNEAIDCIYNGLNEADIEFILLYSPESAHNTFGRDIRNYWRLWEDTSPIKDDFKKKFYNLYGHADDISGIILIGVWAKVKEENIENAMQEAADTYRHFESLKK